MKKKYCVYLPKDSFSELNLDPICSSVVSETQEIHKLNSRAAATQMLK